MTDDYYKDFVLALESAENSYMRELRRGNTLDERSRIRKTYDSFKDFVNKLIAELTKFVAKTQEALAKNIRKTLVKSDVKKALKGVNEKYGTNVEGITIHCPDFARYAVEVRNVSDKVWKEANRIVNKNYVDINQIDIDLNRFDAIFNQSWEDITNAAELKTVMSIEEFRSICKNEISGDSIISKTISNSIHKMKKAEIEIEYITKRRDSMEENRIVPRKLNILQRIIAKIVKFCSKILKLFSEMFGLVLG